MAKKKNKLSTSARPIDAVVELTNDEATKVNGGVFGLFPNPGHPVFGVIINPKHHHKHKKPPFFGVAVHP